ncbi:hypothetical protein GOB82_03505 [Acetobacter farinalis]|nr:hypothetical protein [Acetobacter farinalis]
MSNINVFGGTFELNNTSLSGFSGSNVQNNGQIVLNNGSNMTVSNLQCQVTVNSGSTLALTGNYNSGAHVVYGTGTGNTVLVSSGASQTNLPISNISNGDKIGVNGATVSSATYSDSSGSGPIVLHTTSGQTYTYSDVTYGSDVVRGTSFSAGIQGGDAVICFLSGSMIRTPAGDVAVEDIEIGDQVLAFDWQNNQDVVRPVVWVGKASAKVRARLPDDEAGWPVRVLKDAISDGVPYKDMLITAEHCLFFEGRFVPVRMLVNGVSIFYDKSITSYDYYHVETAEHSVITADGMLTESYLDTGNRSSFRQEGKVATLRATGTRSWSHDAAAPLCVERSFVEPLFRYLETREDQVEGCQTPAVDAVQTTQDPGLHLVMSNGAVIRPIRHQGQDYSFMLPAGVDSVRIVSRVSRPSEVIGPFVDDRRSLGVAVGAICFTDSNQRHQITTHLDGGASEGWHDAAGDSGYVWTKGNALLPLAAQTGGVMGMLTITAVPAEQYSVAPVQTPAALRHSA